MIVQKYLRHKFTPALACNMHWRILASFLRTWQPEIRLLSQATNFPCLSNEQARHLMHTETHFLISGAWLLVGSYVLINSRLSQISSTDISLRDHYDIYTATRKIWFAIFCSANLICNLLSICNLICNLIGLEQWYFSLIWNT